MKKYFSALIGLVLSTCSVERTVVAKNGIEITNEGITKKQVEFLFDNAKSFPNNTQLSIAFIK